MVGLGGDMWMNVKHNRRLTSNECFKQKLLIEINWFRRYTLNNNGDSKYKQVYILLLSSLQSINNSLHVFTFIKYFVIFVIWYIDQIRLKCSSFFNSESLQKFVPFLHSLEWGCASRPRLSQTLVCSKKNFLKNYSNDIDPIEHKKLGK